MLVQQNEFEYEFEFYKVRVLEKKTNLTSLLYFMIDDTWSMIQEFVIISGLVLRVRLIVIVK